MDETFHGATCGMEEEEGKMDPYGFGSVAMTQPDGLWNWPITAQEWKSMMNYKTGIFSPPLLLPQHLNGVKLRLELWRATPHTVVQLWALAYNDQYNCMRSQLPFRVCVEIRFSDGASGHDQVIGSRDLCYKTLGKPGQEVCEVPVSALSLNLPSQVDIIFSRVQAEDDDD